MGIRRNGPRLAVLLLATLRPIPGAAADEPKFERVVIDADFPGAYQVEVADVNGDGRPDIVAVGGATCAWYENPTWKKRVITGPKETPGVISSATTDLDRDGRAEVAIAYEFAMNEPRKGKLGLAVQGGTIDEPWVFRHIADVGSIHRLRWGEFDGEPAQPELVVAPLFGPAATPPDYGDPAELVLFTPGPEFRAGPWARRAVELYRKPGAGPAAPGDRLGRRQILHAIEVTPAWLANFQEAEDGPRLQRSQILTADSEGVLQIQAVAPREGPGLLGFVPGATRLSGPGGGGPKGGASEVHRGKLRDGRGFVATIEPWHGANVVVHLADGKQPGAATPRRVIDDTLAEGHALWVADVDDDGDDEILAGHRGKDHRVALYDFDGKDWRRTVLDDDIAAQDLRGGDIDGDGVPDVVAVGGSTRNVVWYRFKK